MPNGSVDYQKGLIYTIKTGDSVYVGSTTNFRERKWGHKADLKRKKERNLYQTIINNGGEWDMKPYKEFPCNSKLQLEIEEEKIRRELNADLNMIKCNTDKEEKKQEKKEYDAEYVKKNYEKILQQNKEYREKNREAIRKKDRERLICECGCSVNRNGLGRHKKTQKHQNFIKSNNTE